VTRGFTVGTVDKTTHDHSERREQQQESGVADAQHEQSQSPPTAAPNRATDLRRRDLRRSCHGARVGGYLRRERSEIDDPDPIAGKAMTLAGSAINGARTGGDLI
jgi:hypothetical protein